MMDKTEMNDTRDSVRRHYAEVASRDSAPCCEPSSSPCCTQSSPCCAQSGGVAIDADSPSARDQSQQMGYSSDELRDVPESSNMGLGCGNPTAIASLEPGQTVLDLGSGGGLDCFLAARQVGEAGQVIGVDMTPEMVSKARANARVGGYGNVEFRLGEIEHLPVADRSVDIILSNCVINLSPDKPAVFREAFRVLRGGGRLAISDIVATAPIPEEVPRDVDFWSGCISGAAAIDELQQMLQDAGFQEIRIVPKEESREFIREWVPGRNLEQYIVSAIIEAIRPGE